MAGFFKSITVEPFMFLCMMAFFLTFVALPQLILDNVCRLKYNDTTCRIMFTDGSFKIELDIVQQESTLWFGGLLIIATSITVLTLPFVGTVSDEFGRYAAMFLSPVSQLVQAVAFLAIALTGLRFSTWHLLVVGGIPGIVGDISGLYVLTTSYISDITTEKNRTPRLTLLEAATMVSGVAATVSSGLIIESFGYVGIFVVNIGLSILALIHLTFFVKPVKHLKKFVEGQVALLQEKKDLTNVSHSFEEYGTTTNGSMNVDGRECDNEVCPTSGKEDDGNEHNRNELSGNVLAGNGLTGCGVVVTDTAKRGVTLDEACPNENFGEKYGIGNEVLNRIDGVEAREGESMDKAQSGCEVTKDKISGCLVTGNEKRASGNRPSGLEDVCSDRTDDDLAHKDIVEAKQSLRTSKGANRNGTILERLLSIMRESNPIRSLKRVRNVLKEADQLSHGLILFLLMGFSAMCYSGEMSVLALFLKNRPYLLSARDLGFYLAFESGMLGIFGMIFLNYLFTNVVKMDDNSLLLLSYSANVAFFLLLAFAQSLLMLYLIQFVHSIGTLTTCLVRSMLSKTVPASSIGLIFGALMMVETFSVLVGSFVCPVVYASVVAVHPGSVFFINVSLMLLGSMTALFLLCKKRRQGGLLLNLDGIVSE